MGEGGSDVEISILEDKPFIELPSIEKVKAMLAVASGPDFGPISKRLVLEICDINTEDLEDGEMIAIDNIFTSATEHTGDDEATYGLSEEQRINYLSGVDKSSVVNAMADYFLEQWKEEKERLKKL